jgi:hypothetical protein
MNNIYKNPYLEFDSGENSHNSYEIYGINRINELSRQLRTFLNYKAATIQYRYHRKTSACYNKEENGSDLRFKQLASKFIKVLSKIKGNGVSYEIELRRLFDLVLNKVSRTQIIELRSITEQLFTHIHLLSEQEIHLKPLLFKFILDLSQEACRVYNILNSWASGYYVELSLNYSLLYDELDELILLKQGEKNVLKKHRILEEGLLEW